MFGEDALDHFFADPKTCQRAGRVDGGELTLCNPQANNGNSVFYVGRRPFEIEPAGLRGHWAWAAVSPDGKTILGQWSAECEVPQAALIPVSSGKPRLVTKDESVAKGWTTDGRAIVVMPNGPCGGGGHPGTYLVTPDGDATRISRKLLEDLPPSIEPRDAAEVVSAAAP